MSGTETGNSKLKKSKTELLHVIAHTKIPGGGKLADVSVIPHDAEAFARALYAELHRCDAAGAKTIMVESPPDCRSGRASRTGCGARRRELLFTARPFPALPVGEEQAGQQAVRRDVEREIAAESGLRHCFQAEISPAVSRLAPSR